MVAGQTPRAAHEPGGGSFGGFVSLSLAARMDQQGKAPQRIILLAPALWRLPADIVVPESSRLLIVQPANDEIVDPQEVHDWSRAHQYHPHELLKVAECGHFFHGKLIELRDLLKPYL